MDDREPWDDERTLSFAQQAALDAFPEARAGLESRTVRNDEAPHQPTGTLAVEMGSPGLLELAVHLYSGDEGRSQYSLPPVFIAWWARARRGVHSACIDSPTVFRDLAISGPEYAVDVGLFKWILANPRTIELAPLVLECLDGYAAEFVRWAKGFDCILERTGFQDWYSGRRCPRFWLKLSGFRLLMAWLGVVPEAEEQCRQALPQYEWDPRRRTIGCVPVRGLVFGPSRPEVFDRTTALLLQQRILDEETSGSCISAREHQASRQCFKRLFGVDVENAWILPTLHYTEQACLVQLNADFRRASLTPEQQDKFENQGVPSPGKLASQVIAMAKSDLRTTHPSAAVPRWFDSRLALDVMNRYSFGRGGGPDGKRSRLGWAQELNRLARAATSAGQFSP